MGLVDVNRNVNINQQTSYTNSYNLYNPFMSSSLLTTPLFLYNNLSFPQINTDIFSQYASIYKNSQFDFSKFGNLTQSTRLNSNIGASIVSTAKQYLGYKESDGSYKKFTGGRTESWCADFVTYVTKEAFRKNGKTLPSDFGSPQVAKLKQWGKNNNCYTTQVSDAKPGDIVIFNKSHTGIVKEVLPNGKVVTIEGNTSKGNVAEITRSPKDINGFVQIA